LMTAVLWIALAFICGSLPFSYWIGKWAIRKDIRDYGDGNPGATNVTRAGGKKWGALAAFLDALKGALPVGIAYFGQQVIGWPVVLLAIVPVLGHAYSPFLGFRGGKAVAVTFGVWTGVTLWEGPTVLGILLGVWFSVVEVSGWAVMLAMSSLLVYLALTGHDVILLAICALNILVLAWKHRADLAQAPGLRSRFRKLKLS
jgi:acyl phosphate:glycerol-3-phosphate acyltransferase